ncbi:MAG: twin-arginine translocation signal domain-containing protein, partial [Mycobacteriales bacterium]
MDTLTRRRFLAASGVVGATALAAVSTKSWVELVLAGIRNPLPEDARILVLVTLYGGNDGLSTVIPAADPAYRSARPELAYDEADVLPLGDGLGLNPEMKGLHALWKSKQLAVVRGVGYPKPDHSHFRSMDIWQTGSPGGPEHTGWLGRWLDTQAHDPLRAVSLGPVLPPLLAGAKGTGSA